jgi:hypothetical protein
MTRNDSPDWAEQLNKQAADARAYTTEIRKRIVETARAVAATEEQVAGTFDRLAQGRPDRAWHLAELSASARKNAAYQLQWAEDHTAD